MTRRALWILALLVAGVILFWLIPYWALKWSGYLLVVFPNGGDRSQTAVVDFTVKPAPEPLPAVQTDGPVRNVVMLLADGMGFSQLYAARLAEHGAYGQLFLERFPVTGWQTNASIDDVYTDSAASASSIATGHKINTRNLAIDEEGDALPTIAEFLKQQGYKVGLITDSYLWDASVAAFAAHQENRYQFPGVAEQLAASKFDLLVGTHASEESIREPIPDGEPSLLIPFRDHGYSVLENPAQLPTVDGPTVLIYPADSIAERPGRLSEIVDWAINSLAAAEEPFFLFVETEEPDSGSHNRNFSWVLRGLLELDRVAKVAVDFAGSRNDTLVLATSDHETGGFAILSGSQEKPLALRWATPRHTAEPVPVLAFGAGAESFAGVMDNTEFAPRIARVLELNWP